MKQMGPRMGQEAAQGPPEVWQDRRPVQRMPEGCTGDAPGIPEGCVGDAQRIHQGCRRDAGGMTQDVSGIL